MIYILENDKLKIKISSMGAELQSACRVEDGIEYLWQGDPTYWKSRAPHLFPICGRLVDGKYTYRGQTYEMNLHGFVRHMEWTVLHQKTNAITLQVQDTPETLAMYPFRFSLEVCYTLTDESLSVAMIVHNLEERTMPFAVGGHPGFCVPLCPGEAFEDYYLEFDEPCQPRQLCMTDAGLYLDDSEPLLLKDERRLPLRHELFDHDALYLRDMARGVTLRSAEGPHRLHMAFPDMSFVGLWQPPHTDAPFVCIEPWTGVPAVAGSVNDIEQMPERLFLEPGGTYRNVYTMTFR